jgi:hypothetical protein
MLYRLNLSIKSKVFPQIPMQYMFSTILLDYYIDAFGIIYSFLNLNSINSMEVNQ